MTKEGKGVHMMKKSVWAQVEFFREGTEWKEEGGRRPKFQRMDARKD